MKKVLMIIMFVLVLVGIIGFALADNNPNSGSNYDEEQLVGASCGTVTPGYQNECCANKGYSGWDDEEFECIGEQEQNQNKLGATNSYKKTNLTQEQIKNIIRTRNRLISKYGNQSECPNNCTCAGSTIKCAFGNGTRVMTVYAGNSGNVIVQVKNMNMSTNVSLYKSEDGKVYGVFKNNKTQEVMMPDEIKERIQNRTRARIQNETMNLTEDGYHIQAQKRARLFFIFPVKEKVEFSIDSETGEVTKTKTKWWGFLARDVRED